MRSTEQVNYGWVRVFTEESDGHGRACPGRYIGESKCRLLQVSNGNLWLVMEAQGTQYLPHPGRFWMQFEFGGEGFKP